MSNQSNFNIAVNGKTVSIPLARARELCPNEVEKMEIAWNQASVAMGNREVTGSLVVSKEVEQKTYALVHALALKL